MNPIISVFDSNRQRQWKFVLCVTSGLILSTTGNAEGNRQNNSYSTDTPRSCAVPLSSRKASKPVQMKPTVFSQLQTSGQLFKRGTRKRQTDCYISAQAAGKQFAAKTAFLIDLRARQAFQRYRIPGSLNMPAHTLKTKTFLKSRNLILVNEGHNHKTLETLCLNLREAGFSNVSVLHGGLNQWRKQVAPLQGDLLAQRNLDEITPAQFFQVRDYAHWLVVKISPPNDKQQLSSELLNLSLSDNANAFVKQLTAAVAKRTETGVSPYILIVSARGEHELKVKAMLRNTELMNVFYLQGGVYAYQQFIEQQAAMLARVPAAQ
ncbi:MAG: hypothetical protein DRR19_20955 [Candidatus Parabeggiatoa sp. nov. 1]|nr:MAG: hypothetical protein DRR19_20955 [Gammaproteobacteria bacterium]